MEYALMIYALFFKLLLLLMHVCRNLLPRRKKLLLHRLQQFFHA